MRRAVWMACVAIASAIVSGVTIRAQTPASPIVVDRIVARVNGEVVQSLDVRQARLLELFGPGVATDAAVLEALIERRLELADIARYPMVEPAAADVAGRRQAWAKTIATSPGGSNVAARLADAGMTDAALTAWFRDTLRIEAHMAQRFGGGTASRDEMQVYVRAHADDYRTLGGPPVDLTDPAVQADVRAKIAATKRDAAVRAWIDSLEKRADIIR